MSIHTKTQEEKDIRTSPWQDPRSSLGLHLFLEKFSLNKTTYCLVKIFASFLSTSYFGTSPFVSGREEEQLNLGLLNSSSSFPLASPNPPGQRKSSRWWQSQSARHPVKGNVSVQILTRQTSTGSTQLEKATSEHWPAPCTSGINIADWGRKEKIQITLQAPKYKISYSTASTVRHYVSYSPLDIDSKNILRLAKHLLNTQVF